jgi:AcrR family transcriptional regulator
MGDDKMSAKQRDLDATKKALLAAAKELMTSCADADEVTSRAIAAKAGANAAMINYCYGSREALLYEVFKGLLADAQRADPEIARLLCADIAPKERVIMLHFNMMKLMIANFSYSRAITRYLLLNRSGEMGMESLPCITEYFGGRKSEKQCRQITFELSSLHELAVLRHEELRDSCGIDLTDDKILMDYVKKSVDRFLD